MPAPEETGTRHDDQADTADRITASQQVSWWSVHEHVTPLLAEVGSWPTAGTPVWCALDDDDPRKLAAIYDAAQHHALRVEMSQEAACEASRDVSAAADWSAIAQQKFRRDCAIAHGTYYIPRAVTA